MNKKLVICCISMDRLRLLDKLYFKDEFNGEVYIITDDRVNDNSLPIIEFLKNEATNINLKKAKLIYYAKDMFPYIAEQVQPGEYEDALKYMVFSMTCCSSIYFCQSPNDLAFIVDDDVVLFKNPEYLMDGKFRVEAVRTFPPASGRNETITSYYKILPEDVFDIIGIDENDEDFMGKLDAKYGKVISQPTTIWPYLPDLPKFLHDFLYLPSTVKHTLQNRKKNCKLYQVGFTFLVERLMGAIQLYHKCTFYTESDMITQDRSAFIRKAREISEGKVTAYHYTVISDKYVQKWLPYLMENGYDAYKQATKGLEETAKNHKYEYLDPNLMQGWMVTGKLKEYAQQTKPKKVPFFMKGKKNA